MKKAATLALLVVTAAAALLLAPHGVLARLTGVNPTGSSADQFCVGAKSAETCVDSSGNSIPTTNNTQKSGTSALQWSDVEAKNINSGGGSVAVGGQVGLLSQTLAQAQALVPAAAGAEIYCSNCSPAKILVATGTAAGNWADAVGSTFK